jgi:hypothetical protein
MTGASFENNRSRTVTSLDRGALDPVFLASNDFGAVSEFVRSYAVTSARNSVEFRVGQGTSFANVVARAADVVQFRLTETFLQPERLDELMMREDGTTGDILNFQTARSLAKERNISVVVVSAEGAKGQKAVAKLKGDGYRLATAVEATAAHALYRLETSLEGLRLAIDDARLESRSGIPAVGRPTQQSLFAVALTADGLYRYSSYEGIVPGDFGKFTSRIKGSAPEVLIHIKEKPTNASR